jgi:regulator of protease activity HflC (stomatin/prohibitin superfamily)
MAVKNVAASVVLGLLFLSLIVIYLALPPNGLVTFLSVLILLVSLIVALTGGWREIAVMGAFAALASVIAASFAGNIRFGAVGSVLVPIVWVLFLLLVFNWISRNIQIVPKDRAVLIRNTYNGILTQAVSPINRPLIPTVEHRIATIPLYELTKEVDVKDINTESGYNIKMITVHIHYQVAEPRAVLTGIPNRGQAQSIVAKEMAIDANKARDDVTFWERILARQMEIEVDDIVREVIYRGSPNPIDTYKRREDLAGEVRHHLSEMVNRWGVRITLLEFDRVDVDPERFRAMKKEMILERETKEERIKAEREATRIKLTREAEAYGEAERVTAMVKALKESGVDISPEVLEDIVISAIRASMDWGMEGDYARLPAPVSGAPSGDKKDNGSKK